MKSNLTHQNLTPEQFVAYMHGAVDFLPPAGPDAVQWQCIKDMIVRISMEPRASSPSAPAERKTPCGCGPQH